MNKKLNHWTNYWEGGNLTSLPQDFLENYDGDIEEFWNKAFSLVAKQGQTLDLCTGNGAIALLAVAYSEDNQLDFNVTAVDAAKVNVDNLSVKYTHLKSNFNKINLISECLVENIELPENSIDLITSQYGIEYCNWVKAAKQVVKLLKPGGHLIFISHANSSDIMTYMSQEQEQYRTLEQLGLFKILLGYFDKKDSHKETILSLKKLQQLLIQKFNQTNSPLYKGVLDFIHQALAIEKSVLLEHENAIKKFYQQHIFAYARLEDIIDVSRKINDNPHWYSAFEKVGLQLENSGELLQFGKHKAGKYYHFKKPEDLQLIEH